MTGAKSILTIVLITVYLEEVQLNCDSDVVDNISSDLWDSKPPTDIISRLDGTWTIYKADTLPQQKDLECWQQVINSKKALSRELFYWKNHKQNSLETDLYEGPGFVIRRSKKGPPQYSDYMFLLYRDSSVAAWYFCGHEPKSLVVISVRDLSSRKNDPEVEKAIREAEKRVEKLGLKIPPEIATECPIGPSKAAEDASRQYSLPLDPSGLHTMYWTLDYNAKRVFIELHSNILLDSWIALGFSDKGNVENGDFCITWMDSQNMSRFQDIWTGQSATIHIDDQQDCVYEGFKRDNGVTVSAFSRKFDTCDDHDYIIEDGTIHIVWAVGTGPVISADGLDMSVAQHGSVSTRLLMPLDDDPSLSADVWSFDITQNNFKVPKDDISWCKMVQLWEVFKQKHHIVKFEAVVTPGNEHLVHHVILRQCYTLITPAEFPCHSVPNYERNCHRVLAMGLGDFSFPLEAGFVLGGTDSPIYTGLEVHYTPLEKTQDWVDSSGIRLHVTSLLRRYDADVLQLGLENNGETALPPSQPRFPVTSRCIASCTQDGDELITTCWFDTTMRSNVTIAGVGTTDEMCINTVYYYPKVELAVCKSSVSEQRLDEYFRKTNGKVIQSHDQIERLRKNFGSVKWTTENVKSLLNLYSKAPIDVQCIWKKGEMLEAPGRWKNLTAREVAHPLPSPKRPCSVVRSRQ